MRALGGEEVGGLGHEVNAAEDNELGSLFARSSGGELRELEGIAGEIGVADDLVGLVVVAEDDESVAELAATRIDRGGEVIVGERPVSFGELWLPELHVLILVGA